MMKLDPDEKNVLESVERGEWKPISADEVDVPVFVLIFSNDDEDNHGEIS